MLCNSIQGEDHLVEIWSIIYYLDTNTLQMSCSIFRTRTHFSFQNWFYEQVEGVPMGLPVSPIVANLYVECFERKALISAIYPPGHGIHLWLIHGSSKNRHISKNSWTTSIVWTQQLSLQWKGLKQMEPFHSLIPLSHH